jgi:hypothetical protein
MILGGWSATLTLGITEGLLVAREENPQLAEFELHLFLVVLPRACGVAPGKMRTGGPIEQNDDLPSSCLM